MTECIPGENTGTNRRIHEVDAEAAWASADALPKPVRAVVCSAPFDLDTVEIMEFVTEGRRAGWPMDFLVREMCRSLRNAVRQCAEDWGPGYPDIPFTPLVARPRRPARRGRLVL